jgi:hypothetical protein
MQARTAGMGDDADGPVWAALEAARLERCASAGPGGVAARAGGSEDHLPAAAGRKDEVIAAQGDGFFRTQRRVVQAAEERGQLRPTRETSARIARTCAGLATAAGLRATAAFGARQRTRPTGLTGSSLSSTA